MESHRDNRLSFLDDALAQLSSRPEVVGRHVSQMRMLCAEHGAVMSRDHYEPGHFTASAFVLHPEGAQLLLILHKKLGMWLQPGGHIEPTDADFLAAAKREVAEETGLVALEVVDPLFDVDVHTIPPLGGAPAHLHHDLRVLLRSCHADAVAGDDAARARWFSFDEILESRDVLSDGVPTDESVRRVTARLSAR